MDQGQVRVIGTRAESEEEDRLQRFRVLLQQSGGDPSSILDLLATIVRRRDWRKLDDGHGGAKSFLAYFRDLGWSREDLARFVENSRHRYEQPPKVKADVRNEMTWLRAEVRTILNPPLLPHGGTEGNENALKVARETEAGNGGDNITSESAPVRGTDPSYTIRRLQRDAPELAEKVIHGEITPHAAAVQAGFRTRMISVPVDHPERAARTLARHLSPDAIKALIIALSHAAGFAIEHD